MTIDIQNSLEIWGLNGPKVAMKDLDGVEVEAIDEFEEYESH